MLTVVKLNLQRTRAFVKYDIDGLNFLHGVDNTKIRLQMQKTIDILTE